MATLTKKLIVHIEPELHARLTAQAEERGQTLGELVRRALKKGIALDVVTEQFGMKLTVPNLETRSGPIDWEKAAICERILKETR